MSPRTALSSFLFLVPACADAAADPADASGEEDTRVVETIAPDSMEASDTAQVGTPDTSAPSDGVATPIGTELGEVLPDFTLRTCDGEPFQLHATHGTDTTFVHLFAAWCPPCQDDAAATPSDFARLAAIGPSLEWLFVITEDTQGEPPTLAFCQAVADELELPAGVRVLADVDGTFPDHLDLASPNAWGLVLDEAGALSFRQKYGYDAAVAHAAARLAR